MTLSLAKLQFVIHDVVKQLAGDSGLEGRTIRQVIHDSLQHMRFVAALEERLGITLDDDMVMALNFEDEGALVGELSALINSNRNEP